MVARQTNPAPALHAQQGRMSRRSLRRGGRPDVLPPRGHPAHAAPVASLPRTTGSQKPACPLWLPADGEYGVKSKTRPFHALVIEDSEDILEDICDRLDSLGHTCDCASTQEQARERLQRPEGYTYVLLDLEIPVKYGRKSRIQNGRNLLTEIRATSGLEEIPIIVVTSHGKDSPDLAIDVLRHNGADDYITKPFGSNGRSMEQTILDALDETGRSRPGVRKRSKVAKPAKPPVAFEEGRRRWHPHQRGRGNDTPYRGGRAGSDRRSA